jgi:Ca2+-binding EF-hand superfamily protein
MKTVLIAATAALADTAALAQPAAPVAPVAPAAPVRPMADHVMTRTEVVEMVRDHFGRFDTDKDGSITSEEMNTFGRMAERKLPDGAQPRVMIHEGPMGDPAAAFDRLDANKDGMISREEFSKAREQRIEKRIVMREKIKDADKAGKLGEMRMHRRGGMGGTRMIVMADSDHDGKITLSEAETMALKHFDEMDSNHDGQVTGEERGNGRRMIIKEIRKEAPDEG